MAHTKIYYGEYSLSYWIELILKGDIILPPYQRSFVWEKDDFESLLKSFREGQFIPPITIGAFKMEDNYQNLIIDGQQRLTTILLAYLERFPKKEAGTAIVIPLMDENDDENEELDNMIEWDFNRLLEKGKKKSEIQSKCSAVQYEILPSLPEDFFHNTFLGFSYIIPNTTDKREIQKFFSTLFRNINMQGKSLYVLESRAALYYLNADFKDWFDPMFSNNISSSIIDKSVKSKMDFVRYLSLLSQYKRNGTSQRIAYRYAKRMEEYYSEYIASVAYNEDSNLFVKFDSIYPDDNYKNQIEVLSQKIYELGFARIFPSIIDMDIHFFGLIYYILIEKKSFTNDEEKIRRLDSFILRSIKKMKSNQKHIKTPSSLKYIRERIDESLKVYKNYFN